MNPPVLAQFLSSLAAWGQTIRTIFSYVLSFRTMLVLFLVFAVALIVSAATQKNSLAYRKAFPTYLATALLLVVLLPLTAIRSCIVWVRSLPPPHHTTFRTPASQTQSSQTPVVPKANSVDASKLPSVQFFSVPNSYIPLVHKATELARRNPHCLKVTDGDYSSKPTWGNPAPIFITCIVDNPRVSSWPYANYFYTTEQIEKGIVKPYSTIGEKPVWNAQERALADHLQRTATERCWEFIRSQASFPDSVEDQHWYDSPEVRLFDDSTTGQPWVSVSFRFQAKNYLGAELPYRARCEIKANGRLKGWIYK